MDASQLDLDRLAAGEAVNCDPGLRPVADFLAELEAECPLPPVDHVARKHLAAVAHESRRTSLAARAPARSAARRRRVWATGGISALVVFTAGAGVASALGGNPLPGLIPDLTLTRPASTVPSIPPELTSSAATPEPSQAPSASDAPGAPSEHPAGGPAQSPGSPASPDTSRGEPGAANSQVSGDPGDGAGETASGTPGEAASVSPSAYPGKRPSAHPGNRPTENPGKRPSANPGKGKTSGDGEQAIDETSADPERYLR